MDAVHHVVHTGYAAPTQAREAVPQVMGTHPGAWLDSLRAGAGPENRGAEGGLYATLPQQARPEVEEEPVVISLVVPDEATHGTKLQYTAPDGQELRLTVPDGVPPGSVMTLYQDPQTKCWRCEAEPPDDEEEEELSAGMVEQPVGSYQPPIASVASTTTAPTHSAPAVAVASPSPVAGRLVPTGAQPHTVTTISRHVVGQPMAVNLSYVPPPGAGHTVYTASYTPPPVAVMQAHPSYAPPPAQAMTSLPSYTPPPVVIQQQHPSYTPPPMQAAVASYTDRPSYTPPPAVVMQQGPSYTPPPMVMTQRPSYTPPVAVLPGAFAPVDPSQMATTTEVRPIAVASAAKGPNGPSITTLPSQQIHQDAAGQMLPQQHMVGHQPAMMQGHVVAATAPAGVHAAVQQPNQFQSIGFGVDLPPITLPPFPLVAPQIGIPNANFSTTHPAPMMGGLPGGALPGGALHGGALPGGDLFGNLGHAGMGMGGLMQPTALSMQPGALPAFPQAPHAGFGGFNPPQQIQPGMGMQGGLQPNLAPQAPWVTVG